MNDNFAAKFIWACAFLFACSLAVEKFLFKIGKMNLTTSWRKKSPQLLDWSKHKYISVFCFVSRYISIRSNRRSLLIIWAMFTYLQMFFELYYYCSSVTYVNYNNKFCIASPEAEMFCKKGAFKTCTEFTGKHWYCSLFLI